MVCSRCKLLGRRLTGIARELPVAHEMGWLVLGLRPAGDRGVWSDSKEVWKHGPKSECPSRTPMQRQRESTETEVRA